jgi:hypothetical protein
MLAHGLMRVSDVQLVTGGRVWDRKTEEVVAPAVTDLSSRKANMQKLLTECA